MIDKDGYRLNVGIILLNQNNQLFWGQRLGPNNGWQFPQGGIHKHESLIQAMYRELEEEIGLTAKDVEILAASQRWLYYRLPERSIRQHHKPVCIGQKQKWVLLRLVSTESAIVLDKTGSPEFSNWKWVSWEYPAQHVIEFKQRVYKLALEEFATFLAEK